MEEKEWVGKESILNKGVSTNENMGGKVYCKKLRVD